MLKKIFSVVLAVLLLLPCGNIVIANQASGNSGRKVSSQGNAIDSVSDPASDPAAGATDNEESGLTSDDSNAAEPSIGKSSQDDTVPELPEEISTEDVKDIGEFAHTFESVARNEEAELLIDKSNNTLRLVSRSGKYIDTKVMNGQIGNDFIKNAQKSDFVLTYYTDQVKAKTKTMDNYSMSIAFQQVEYTPIDNGIRCSFLVGEPDRVQLSMFPMFIGKERMQELVLQYLDDAQIAEMFGKSGYYTETKDRFIRNWDATKKDGTATEVAIPKLKRMYHYFYELGAYNEKELETDNLEWGQEVIDTNITIKVAVEYLLDGGDLVVRVPAGGIETDGKYPVSDLTLTPYLLSGDIYEEGYLFVPDGSGGILNFNSGKTTTDVLSIPIYGSDILKNSHFYREPFVPSTLPVVGMKKNDMAVLGIIEEGAELATVSANVAGKVDEFNKVNVTFNLLYMEKIPMTIGFGNYMFKYANSPYRGNITMRYKILEGDRANYTGMAKMYKEYLKSRQELRENPVPENAPLFVEMVATVPNEKVFLGIPYTTYTSMTSFENARSILEALKKDQIDPIILQYTDWANGGAKNTPFTKLKVIGSIGGRKSLTELLSYGEKEGVSIFPTVKLLTSYSTRGIRASRDITRFLDNTKAVLPVFNLVTRQVDQFRQWLISPGFLPDYVSKVLSWAKRTGIENLAVDNAGVLLYGNYYRKKQLMRSDALPLFRKALDSLSKECNLLFSNANSYAYANASCITDLPAYGSGRRAVDYSVPFTQMVLENDVPYSMEAFNQNNTRSPEYYLLKAIETKSSLKWILTKEDEKEFTEAYLSKKFIMKPYFQTKFSRWKDRIGEYYREYNSFYQKVRNAEITSHELLEKDFVKVAYTNGVTVYLNYGTEKKTADGTVVDPLSYTIKELRGNEE